MDYENLRILPYLVVVLREVRAYGIDHTFFQILWYQLTRPASKNLSGLFCLQGLCPLSVADKFLHELISKQIELLGP